MPRPPELANAVVPGRDRLVQPIPTERGEVMVWERVADAIRLGGSLHDAAARAGVGKAVLQGWLRNGTRLQAAIGQGARDPDSLTAHEQAEMQLAVVVDRAEAEAKLVLLGLLDRVTRGVEVRTVTVKIDQSGQEVERTERTENRGPDPATIRWRLERRWPEEFGQRVRAEVVAQIDTGPERVAELADALRSHLGANGAKVRSDPKGTKLGGDPPAPDQE